MWRMEARDVHSRLYQLFHLLNFKWSEDTQSNMHVSMFRIWHAKCFEPTFSLSTCSRLDIRHFLSMYGLYGAHRECMEMHKTSRTRYLYQMQYCAHYCESFCAAQFRPHSPNIWRFAYQLVQPHISLLRFAKSNLNREFTHDRVCANY